ncbi:2-hydroxyacid dehydrogenase [Marinobacterium sedimentorum]|uniref:2-hydroxyacid dehydrogenase n=1 Tax=Marinobacterium sedimentorum TaxID=2927804 RepID=UPI0020C74656|nr:2-hydroxyacid dehydrogenase [Marinobacterium sedimentorum]MCP8686917.1 2-hydroxyacid dehydrogenase [Marinobacterium sedimentorum]
MHKAVFLDLESLEDIDLAALAGEFKCFETHMATGPLEVAARIRDAEVVLVNKVRLDAAALQQAPRLKLICVVATGTNNVDLEAAQRLGIQVSNCRAYGNDSVIQHVFALLLALSTRLLDYHQAVQGGRWQQAGQFCFLDFPIAELAGKTLGIVGYGNLGQGVGRIAEAFGMKVMVAQRPGGPAEAGRTPLDQLLPQVDVLTLHCPLTEHTRNLLDAAAFKRMKNSALLINVARGGIVDERALADALRSGALAGAATDVLSVEPPRDGNPLLSGDIPNLIVTPHSAWGSTEARQRIIAQTLDTIQAFGRGEALRVVS